MKNAALGFFIAPTCIILNSVKIYARGSYEREGMEGRESDA